MRVVTVSGAGSGAGKTTLSCILLGRLHGFAAVKVSAGGLYASVTDEPGTTGEEGKDTALMREAGASKVVLVRCPREEMEESLSQALTLAGDAPGVIIEGNSPARLVKADVSFFVTGEDISGAKPGGLELLSKADVVVVNVEADEPPEEVLRQVRAHNRAGAVTTMGRMRAGCDELDGLIRKLAG